MDLNFNKNEDYNKLLLSDLKQRFAKVRLGGGAKRIVSKLVHLLAKGCMQNMAVVLLVALL